MRYINSLYFYAYYFLIMMSPYSWRNLIASFHVSPHSPHPSLNMNIGQTKGRCLHCGNVILFVGFKYWFFSQLYYLVNIKFTIFIIWIQFVALATYLTIFKGIYAMIWELFYVFKYMRSNCLLWWWIFTLFLGYCYLYEVTTTTQ